MNRKLPSRYVSRISQPGQIIQYHYLELGLTISIAWQVPTIMYNKIKELCRYERNGRIKTWDVVVVYLECRLHCAGFHALQLSQPVDSLAHFSHRSSRAGICESAHGGFMNEHKAGPQLPLQATVCFKPVISNNSDWLGLSTPVH